MEQQSEQLYEVVLEMLKNEGYLYKGQEIKEVVWAADRDKAVEQVCKLNEISRDNTLEKGVKLWEG